LEPPFRRRRRIENRDGFPRHGPPEGTGGFPDGFFETGIGKGDGGQEPVGTGRQHTSGVKIEGITQNLEYFVKTIFAVPGFHQDLQPRQENLGDLALLDLLLPGFFKIEEGFP